MSFKHCGHWIASSLKIALECSLKTALVMITLTDQECDVMRKGAGVWEEDGEICGVESHTNLKLTQSQLIKTMQDCRILLPLIKQQLFWWKYFRNSHEQKFILSNFKM